MITILDNVAWKSKMREKKVLLEKTETAPREERFKLSIDEDTLQRIS